MSRSFDYRDRDPDIRDIPIEDDSDDTAAGAARDPMPMPQVDEPVDPFYEAARAAEERYLRLMADFENYRKRAFREREAAEAATAERVTLPLLDVLDNLERALEHAGASPGPLRDGVALTVRQFHEALRRAGVESIDPGKGEAFDPTLHEAITTQPSKDVATDHVVLVVSRGYRFGDRVIRPAKVIVSRGVEGPAAS
jgi:molecular chaperone GrpE